MPVKDALQPADESAAETHFKSAKALQAEGRVAEAASELVAGLQLDPRNESAHLSLAGMLLELRLFHLRPLRTIPGV